MQAYRVIGEAPFGKQKQKFSLDIVAKNTEDAKHRIYSIIGSRHKATRRQINITSVSKIDPRASTEPTILSNFREEIAKYSGATFAELDLDKDGALSKEEVEASVKLPDEVFEEMDADGDGSVSMDEFDAAATALSEEE